MNMLVHVFVLVGCTARHGTSGSHVGTCLVIGGTAKQATVSGLVLN